ncbi:mitochondrial ubiquitin ligase activator of nfkb 1 [Biomphalaria pfeifferi]|uniref:RING-type E3 ubiquitin transferase n=1 Tax=Biomphalaria pfeifferi TaxID=112525 RepID=A0AAD8CAK9_BIOPF|nr:mitochondrial ubiquitin ligase activator of nfkb 1 [Biomphalaria pfeifferi]
MVVIDVVDKVVSVGGALANILAFVLYKYYRNRSETARLVKQTTIWNPDAELYDHLNQQKDHSLQYAVVEGVVKDLGRVLQGRYSKNDGVILHTEIIEHQSKRVNGFWSDMKKAIKDSTEIVPFAIANNSLDRLFGEVTKGIQETESMLLTGTSVIGVGKVFLERGALKMAAADDPNRTFILTKMRKPELVRTLESQSSTFKMLSVLCFVIGGSMLGYLIWRHVKKILEEKKRRQEFEEIQRVLQSSQSTQGSHNEDSRADETCVVCLSNPRQVITLNCGHIAMCATCAELLPYPKKCPVCRADIERFVAVYRP